MGTPAMHMRIVLLLGLRAWLGGAEPNTCQPRSQQPFMPIYHIIGNVTSTPTGAVTNVESINDVSSVFRYKDVYHVFHQCCQNHWDHVVSKDLIHWTRLLPPIVPNMNPTNEPHPDWYDAHGSWDGSLSVPNEWNGLKEPVVIMTTVEGTPPAGTNRSRVGGHVGMAVVHPTNSTDPFLVSWTKDPHNPIEFDSGVLTTPYDTPGQVWRNGNHWNFLILGERYTTTDPKLHTWGVAPGPKFINAGENGGQWFSKLANLKDGSAPPAGSPGWMMNVGGGNRYDLGTYNQANETWTTTVSGSTIDSGPNANWMVGQFAGKRFMNIGWSTGGPPMTDYVDAAPGMRQRRAPEAAALGECQFTKSWEVYPGYTNIYDREPSPTNVTQGTIKFIGLFDSAEECFGALNASTQGPFNSFTWNDATIPPPYGRHCWGDTSMIWQNRGGAKGQTSGRGPGFPVAPWLPPNTGYTRDHLTGLRQVAYDPQIKGLISNPVSELSNLRNSTLGTAKRIAVAAGTSHIVSGTGFPADASTSDVVVNISVPTTVAAGSAIGVSVLANVSNGKPFGGVLAMVNFTAPDSSGTINAMASIRTLDPCASSPDAGSPTTAHFQILKGETSLEIRMLVDRSIVEVFVMGGRVVFTQMFNPAVLYVPDTNVALHSWGTNAIATVDVFSMGCGWTNAPYQPNPTMESISDF